MDLPPLMLASLGGGFSWVDWVIVAGYFALTTWLGGALAGRQASIRDFFLGGRKLPWYAVSGSIVATEISAVTFISVPYLVFLPGGDISYLQLGLFGSLIARVIVACVLMPAYFKREIYSPYDYMGNQLGGSARSTSTCLFALGGLLAQSARVYLTALVLRVILHDELTSLATATGVSALAWSVIAIGVVSIAWTLMGGIATVIWTDVLLFGVFLVGAVVAFCTVANSVDGGVREVFRVGQEAGKFRFLDWSPQPWVAYTVWTAVIANTWFGVALYGTDQLMAQRMFCCRNLRDARWAIITSQVGQVVTIMMMLVGVGLFAYYRQHPLTGEALATYQHKGDSIFPIFIMQKIPTGLKGLIIAGVFAAAVSSLDSIMAALSQTVMSAFYTPLRKRKLERLRGTPGVVLDEEREARRDVVVSRMFVVGWGVLLCCLAVVAERVAARYQSIVDLALAMAGYTAGGLFAGFLLAFLPLRLDGRGFLVSGPLSVLAVFALVWHQPLAQDVCLLAGGTMLLLWRPGRACDRGSWVRKPLPQMLILAAGVALVYLISRHGYFVVRNEVTGVLEDQNVSWPWYAPVGSLFAFIWGYLLAQKKEATADER